MSAAEPALSVRNLSLELPTPRGDLRLLQDVSFDVGSGELVGLVGESGSGKSLTALSIQRLLPRGARLTGSINFDGMDLTSLGEARLRRVRGARIGMVFQDPMTTLDPVVRVGAQIGEAYAIHHRRASRARVRQRTIEMLEMVGVPDAERRARQYPHQWSGGMRQRAVIAMALVNEPEVIIADEPTTALDATTQAQVLDALLRVQQELDVAVVLITHDLGLIAQVASRVVVMYAGRVVETADTRQLFDDSRHPYSQALMRSRPAAHHRGGALQVIPGRPPAMSAIPTGCPFEPRCSHPAKDDRCATDRPEMLSSVDRRWSACHFRDQPQEVHE